MKKFFKSGVFKFLSLIAFFIIGIMIYAASTEGIATIPETIIGTIVTPIQSAGSNVTNSLKGFYKNLTGKNETQKKNEELDKEINELREKLVEYDEYKRTNEMLREYLDLKAQNPDHIYADGRIIAVDTSNTYGNFTINAGSNKGIKVNDPVITPSGLVGTVYEVGVTYSKIQTILSSSVHVAVSISRTNDNAVTSGTVPLAKEGMVALETLSKDSTATVGDYVVTSGKSSLYPPGLLIGRVSEIEPGSEGLSMYATVELFADIPNITDVFVITSFEGQGEKTAEEKTAEPETTQSKK